MYKFVDPNTSSEVVSLPPEALCYNGKYLENEIPGYRTLWVTGRELVEADIQEQKINGLDGSIYLNKRYSTRKITVGYQLLAESNKAFRDAFNKMNLLLSGEQVEISFADEIDKYFIGTKSESEIPNEGTNSIVSKFEIYCTDPFKYSKTLKEFTPTVNEDGVLECTIKNEGSMSANVEYEVINSQANGYLGIVSEYGAMEFGKREEADKELVNFNETLVTLDDFIKATDDVGGKDVMHPNYGTSGKLTIKKMCGDKDWLTFGTQGTKKGSANGRLRTVTIPVDSNGNKGATNFYAYMRVLVWAQKMGQTGEMSVSFLTDDNTFICGYNWYKTDTSGNRAHFDMLWHKPNAKSSDALHAKGKTFSFISSHIKTENPFYWDWGNIDIRKEGSKLTFYYNGNNYSYVIPEVENMVCTKIQIACKAWDGRLNDKFMHWMGFDTFNFQKIGVEKWQDVQNRYAKGSTIQIDGENAKIYVNGMPKQEDEIIGTKYFKVPNGDTVVKFYPSSFVTTQPTIKVRIREAWL